MLMTKQEVTEFKKDLEAYLDLKIPSKYKIVINSKKTKIKIKFKSRIYKELNSYIREKIGVYNVPCSIYTYKEIKKALYTEKLPIMQWIKSILYEINIFMLHNASNITFYPSDTFSDRILSIVNSILKEDFNPNILSTKLPSSKKNLKKVSSTKKYKKSRRLFNNTPNYADRDYSEREGLNLFYTEIDSIICEEINKKIKFNKEKREKRLKEKKEKQKNRTDTMFLPGNSRKVPRRRTMQNYYDDVAPEDITDWRRIYG